MKKILILGVIVMLATILPGFSGCSATGTVSAPLTVSNSGGPAASTQAGVLPPQGTSGSIPMLPPQGAPAPATVFPSPGIEIPGAASSTQGVSNPAMMYPSQPSNYPYYPPFYGQPQNTGIWVTGLGQVSVSPDIANLTMGVEAQSLTVADAQDKVSTTANAIIQVLKGKGVADKDITTVSYNISPLRNYRNNTLIGYQVSDLITAKVRNITGTGSIIDAVTSAGGNFLQINSLSFTVDDPSAFLKQARQLAMEDASAKANQLASLAGVKLGPPTYISEYTSGYIPIPVWYGQGAAVQSAQGATAPVPVPQTPINPEQKQISVTVQVIYSIQ